VYGVLAAHELSHMVYSGLDSWLNSNGYKCFSSNFDCNDDVLNQISLFFNSEFSNSKNWFFSYISRVLLSVESYADLQQIFLIDVFLRKNPTANLVIYCPNKKLSALISAIFLKGTQVTNKFPSLYAWARFARTLLRVILNRSRNVNPDLLILTLSTSPPKNDDDVYFGNLPSVARNNFSTVVVYLSAGNKLKLPQHENLASLEAFATFSDVMRAWMANLVESFSSSSETAFNGSSPMFSETSKFMKKSEVLNGDFFYHRFLSLTFDRIFQEIKPKVLLYPFENRSWEKLLLIAAGNAGIKNRIGYQHSSITPRHFALKILKNDQSDNELPEKIITVGKVTYDWLKLNAPAVSDRLVLGGSLRRIQENLDRPTKLGILVAISSSIDEARKLLNIVNAFSKMTCTNIIIRSHPTIFIDELFDSLDWPDNVVLSKNRSLKQDVSDSAIIIYSSSTVVIEGMLSGRLPIFLDIGNIPAGDPLLGGAEFKYTAATAKDLLDILETIESYNEDQLTQLQSKMITYAENYLPCIASQDFLKLLTL